MAKPRKPRKTTPPSKRTLSQYTAKLPQWQQLIFWLIALVLGACALAMMVIQPIAGAIWLIAAILVAPPILHKLSWRTWQNMAASLILGAIGLIAAVVLGGKEHSPDATLDTGAQIVSQASNIASEQAKSATDSLNKQVKQSADATSSALGGISSSIDELGTAISSPISQSTDRINAKLDEWRALTKPNTKSNGVDNDSDRAAARPADHAISCHIVGVSDGDTATCLDANKQQIKIRFAQIDAPERGQDYGQVAKQALSDQIYGKSVVLAITEYDRYGRAVAEVFVNGRNINKQMVADGYAWAYRAYMTDNDYLLLESQAKSQDLGLWSQPNPIYPEEFRKAKRQ